MVAYARALHNGSPAQLRHGVELSVYVSHHMQLVAGTEINWRIVRESTEMQTNPRFARIPSRVSLRLGISFLRVPEEQRVAPTESLVRLRPLGCWLLADADGVKRKRRHVILTARSYRVAAS